MPYREQLASHPDEATSKQLRQELSDAVGMLNHQLKRNGELFRENEALRQQIAELQMRAAA